MRRKINWVLSVPVAAGFLGYALLSGAVAQTAEELKPLDLDGTTWQVKVVATDQARAKEKEATLTFEEGKFTAEGALGSGYEPTNYTLDVREDGTTTFKTIQTKAKETTFWQGEVLESSKVIQGTIGVNSAKGAVQNYVFAGPMVSGTLKPKADAPPPMPAPEEVPAAAQEPAEPSQPSEEGSTEGEPKKGFLEKIF